MRTRFLNVDYFSCSSSPNETPTFLNLPVPHLPHPCRLANFEEYLVGSNPVTNISLEIERFPIDVALSKFMTEVIPHFVDVEYGDYEDTLSRDCKKSRPCSVSDQILLSEKKGEVLYEEKEERSLRVPRSGAFEKDDETAADDGHTHRFQIIQFEAPELDDFVESAFLLKEEMEFLSEVPEIKNNVELSSPEFEMQYSVKVKKSLYSVEDITLEHVLDQKAHVFEDDGFVREQMCSGHKTFPLLEVDEISLRNFTNPSEQDALMSFLENIEWTQKDNILSDGLELLDPMHDDTYGVLLDHYLSNKCLEFEPADLDMFLQMDIISLVEILWTKEDSIGCLLPDQSVDFEEFKFLDVHSSQFYEVFFEMQTTNEPETCDLMFSEDMKCKDFNDLIVSCELALTDDIFKSLPIPILSDHVKLRPMHVIFEEILAELKPQPLSVSDWIYLDWYLLEENKCISKIFSSYHNILEELNPYKIDFEQESFDYRKLVIDLVFYDPALNGLEPEKYEEFLTMAAECTSGCQFAVDDKCPKEANEKQLPEENAIKASLLFKSMSQFNDLDFFLNHGKVTTKEKCESASKTHDANTPTSKEWGLHAILQQDGSINDQKLGELMNDVPIDEEYNLTSSEAAGKLHACCTPMPAPSASHTTTSDQNQSGRLSFPETIIVMNTQNFYKEMIVSRRSTYQKILAMEKEGAQVVERDLNLPVDIVVSSAICLVWYDCRNIGGRTTAAEDAYACLPSCIENIATNVLILLSFSFSACILVFEGEASFLSFVMESSDAFYAAAAGLGIELQLFYSHSSELTDEIILSSILYATKLYKEKYPKMSESETLAESFLTKFPSINPLMAHAILSSECMLIEFLRWSHERRILEVQKFHIPDESIALFSALCRYGEREDSKSIMTDWSFSVFSGPDSDKFDFNFDSERKRQKCISNPQKSDIIMDDMWQSETVDNLTDGKQCPSKGFKQHNYWVSTSLEPVHELKRPSTSLKNFSYQEQESNIAWVEDFSNVCKPYNSENFKCPQILDNITKSSLSLDDKLWGQDRHLEITFKGKLNRNDTSESEKLQEDVIGEVIDLTGSPLLDKDAPSTTNTMYFSPWLPAIAEDSDRKCKAARRLSIDKSSHPLFPTSAEIDSDLWTSVKECSQSLQEKNGYADIDDNHGNVHLKQQKNLLEEILGRQSARNSTGSPFKEQMSHYCGTPLSKAIHSSHPQPGSPWTIEFLNRIREKSRMRQQSLPCDTSPGFRYSGNKSKVTKRRSPSILEFFKYQEGGIPGKIDEQKKQTRSIRLPNSSKGKKDYSLLPTWTPNDKRSRKTLSFAMNDTGSQTRLVWSDGSAHRLSKKFRNQ